MTKVQYKRVSKTFVSDKGRLKTLDAVDLTIHKGEFVTIIGPSGCGKSTIFHLLTKLVGDFEGEILMDCLALKDSNQLVSYMHQKDLLMPWRTLMENVILPMELAGNKKGEAEGKVKDLLPTFGLAGFESAYPNELSGGMRQRAALLRTFMVDSDIMLLDEPFAALDAISRHKMQQFLLEKWQQFSRTVMFITHDIEEAIYLSDRIIVLSGRPAKVLDVVDIPIRRPREKHVLLEKEFLEIKERLINYLET